MFDYNTVPRFAIKPASIGEFSLSYEENTYRLCRGDIQLMCLYKPNYRELKEQYAMYDLAYGDVILTGFGLGILPLWVASKPNVTSVTVLEMSKEVVDLFLLHNTMPENITIIYANAKTYTTDKKYDCLFMDHFPDHKEWPVYKEVAQIANNIPHKVLWFYGLESHYVRNYYGMKAVDLIRHFPSLDDYDFTLEWKNYAKTFDLDTFPKLDDETLKYYLRCFFVRI
jgi:spermidine synthase